MKTNNKSKDFYYTAMWPLWPFHLAQNEAAFISGSIDIPDISNLSGTSFPIPRNYFLNNSRFEVFGHFLLLSRDLPFELGECKECNFLQSIQVSSFQSGSSTLNEMFNNPPRGCGQPVTRCKDCIEQLYPIVPQRFNAQELLVSEFLTALENNNLRKSGFTQDQYNSYWEKPVSIQSWAKDAIFWIAGENLFQASKIWWGKSGLEILREGGLFTPGSQNAKVILVPVSFFYDKLPDLLFNVFINPKSPSEPARHILGLTYAMKEARKSLLFDWVGRLSETIMKMDNRESFKFLSKHSHLKDYHEKLEKGYKESLDKTKKQLRIMYARESLEWMARVLAFLETSPENAAGDGDPKTFMDYSENMELAVSSSLKKTENSTEKAKMTHKGIVFSGQGQGSGLFGNSWRSQQPQLTRSWMQKGLLKLKGASPRPSRPTFCGMFV